MLTLNLKTFTRKIVENAECISCGDESTKGGICIPIRKTETKEQMQNLSRNIVQANGLFLDGVAKIRMLKAGINVFTQTYQYTGVNMQSPETGDGGGYDVCGFNPQRPQAPIKDSYCVTPTTAFKHFEFCAKERLGTEYETYSFDQLNANAPDYLDQTYAESNLEEFISYMIEGTYWGIAANKNPKSKNYNTSSPVTGSVTNGIITGVFPQIYKAINNNAIKTSVRYSFLGSEWVVGRCIRARIGDFWINVSYSDFSNLNDAIAEFSRLLMTIILPNESTPLFDVFQNLNSITLVFEKHTLNINIGIFDCSLPNSQCNFSENTSVSESVLSMTPFLKKRPNELPYMPFGTDHYKNLTAFISELSVRRSKKQSYFELSVKSREQNDVYIVYVDPQILTELAFYATMSSINAQNGSPQASTGEAFLLSLENVHKVKILPNHMLIGTGIIVAFPKESIILNDFGNAVVNSGWKSPTCDYWFFKIEQIVASPTIENMDGIYINSLCAPYFNNINYTEIPKESCDNIICPETYENGCQVESLSCKELKESLNIQVQVDTSLTTFVFSLANIGAEWQFESGEVVFSIKNTANGVLQNIVVNNATFVFATPLQNDDEVLVSFKYVVKKTTNDDTCEGELLKEFKIKNNTIVT